MSLLRLWSPATRPYPRVQAYFAVLPMALLTKWTILQKLAFDLPSRKDLAMGKQDSDEQMALYEGTA